MIKPKVVLLTFVSGKIVLAGAKVTVLECWLFLVANADISVCVLRCGRRYTRRSTRSTPCCASSASRNDRVARHSSPPTPGREREIALSVDGAFKDTPGLNSFTFTRKRFV